MRSDNQELMCLSQTKLSRQRGISAIEYPIEAHTLRRSDTFEEQHRIDQGAIVFGALTICLCQYSFPSSNIVESLQIKSEADI